MESKGSRTGEICPKLLDLIHSKGRERIMRGDHEGRSFGVSEEKKLELKLGPPGEEDWFMNENQTRETFQQSPLSLGCFSSMASQNPNSPFNGNLTPWCSTSSQSPSLSSFQATQQQQQQLKHSFLGFPSIPQNLPVLAKESSQICNKKLLELQNSEKKACSPASTTANTVVNNTSNNSSQKRTAPAPVVGWPPIRSFRKNLANSSSSKPVPESQNGAPSKDSTTTIVKPETCTRKGLFVKINMDGVPIGRKVDLKAYDSYEKLSSAVDELFRGLLSAQRDSSANLNCKHVDEVSEITGILDGSGEYTLVYEDNEGDRMLVGDVPWDMFASTVKRLRVLKSSELSTLHLGSTKQGKTLVTGVQ